jgi:hypothetical protein
MTLFQIPPLFGILFLWFWFHCLSVKLSPSEALLSLVLSATDPQRNLKLNKCQEKLFRC